MKGPKNTSEKEKILELYKRLEKKGSAQNVQVPDEVFDENGVHEYELNPAEILAMIRSAQDEDTIVECIRKLGKMRAVVAEDVLAAILHQSKSEKIKASAIRALGFISPEKYYDEFVDLLEDVFGQSIRVRKASAFAVSRGEPIQVVNILVNTIFNDPDPDVRIESAEVIAIVLMKLEKNLSADIAKTLTTHIDHENEADENVRIAILNALTVSECDESIDEMISVLKSDPSGRVRGQAASALSHFFDPRIEMALIESFDKEDEGTRKRIALAIAAYAMKNPLGLHDEICKSLIKIQKIYPRDSYIWKEAVKAMPAV